MTGRVAVLYYPSTVVSIGRFFARVFREWGPVIIAVLLIRSFLVEAFMVPTGSMEKTIAVGDFMLVNKFIYGIRLPFSDRTVVPVSSPKRGDIVVFRYPMDSDLPEPETRYLRFFPEWLPLLPLYWDREARFFAWHVPRNFIKRCVAVAGDTLEHRAKRLYVNGMPQHEPYTIYSDRRVMPSLDYSPADFEQGWLGGHFHQSALSGYVRDNFGPVVVPEGHVFVMGDNRDNSEDSRFWGPLELRHLKGKPLVLYFSSSSAPSIAKILASPHRIRVGRIGRIVR